MVEIFGLCQGRVHSARKHRPYTKLRQSLDLPAADGAGGTLTAERDRNQVTEAKENILSFIWISGGTGKYFAGVTAF